MRYRRPRLAILASHVVQYQAPLYRALAAEGSVELTVLFCSANGHTGYVDAGFGQRIKWDRPLLDGYESRFLPNLSPTPDPSRFWGLVNPAVVRSLRDFDALLVPGWSRCTEWLAMLAAFQSGLPVLLRAETNVVPERHRGGVLTRNAVLRRLFRRVAACLAIGRYSSEFYRAFGVRAEQIFLSPYAVDNEFFIRQADDLRPRRDDLKQALGIAPDVPVVLFSGKLTSVKRPVDLLMAFEQVRRHQPAALVYLGDGALRGQIEDDVRRRNIPNVYCVGFRNQSELGSIMAAADLLVLPSMHEPWGLVVNEAMCFSLPVVVSNRVGAGGDLVREGENGHVFPAGDVGELARILEQVLGDETRRREMGRASRRLIEGWGLASAAAGILEAVAFVTSATDGTAAIA